MRQAATKYLLENGLKGVVKKLVKKKAFTSDYDTKAFLDVFQDTIGEFYSWRNNGKK